MNVFLHIYIYLLNVLSCLNKKFLFYIANRILVCSDFYRRKTKEPDLRMWPQPSPGDLPVLQTLMRRKTGEALEQSSDSVQNNFT